MNFWVGRTMWPLERTRLQATQQLGVIFIFIFFENIFYRNIFSILQFIILYPCRPPRDGRGPAARQEGGRDLYVNKKNYLRGGPWREPAARQGGGRLPRKIAMTHYMCFRYGYK